jgi:predicted lipoprotein with Yx(FWY)xxD motif
MKTRLISTLALSLVAVVSTFAQADMAVKGQGGMLVNTAGMTVYTFDKDVAGSGKSTCNGPCATLWPAVMAAADAKPEGDMTIVTRDDGAKQWAYKGKPVYLYSADTKPGDKTGDNFKDVWHVIKP